MPFKTDLVFVTKQEREEYYSVQNMKIVDLKKEIVKAINQINEEEMKDIYMAIYENDVLHMKGGRATAADYIAILTEVQDYLLKNEMQEEVPDIPGDD